MSTYHREMPPVSSKPTEWPYARVDHFPGTIERLAYRTYNWFENRLWPVGPLSFLTLITASTAYQLRGLQELKDGPEAIVKPLALGVTCVYSSVFLLRHLLKYFFFSYTGYLKESPKKPSYRTIVWAAIHKLLLKVSPPQLNSCDRLLPNLPLPSLADTVHRYVDSMRNVLSEGEFDQLVAESRRFLANEGRTLQRFVWIWHKFRDNYVTGLWEKYMYHSGRYSLLINSSTAQVTMYGENDITQVYMLARLLHIETLANLSVDRQKYLAVGGGLLCTSHYKNVYNGCRVPGKECDSYQRNTPSRHAAVVHEGTWYKVYTCDANGMIYSIEQLARIVSELMQRDDKETGTMRKVACLTTDGRAEWSANRHKFFLDNRHNRPLLEAIETAQFVVSIDGDLGWGAGTTEELSAYLKGMLVGDGTNKWMDKTMNYAVDANGRGGAAGEHSMCDGAEMDHLCENYLIIDKQTLETPSREEQLALERGLSEEEKGSLRLAERLEFKRIEGMEAEIERCFGNYQKAVGDFHLHSMAFLDFGKGRLKKCGISPDGFAQMAIQLAYFKDQGKFVLTYESGSVRRYANSRTDTVRPVTDASCRFVNAMVNEQSTKSERRSLLKEACEVHVNNCKEVMLGNGIDRHMFVLCVFAKALGYSSPFLDSYVNQKWLLSTSNIPNMTNAIDEDSSVNNIMLGGLFGAVAHDGYGICYRFGGNRAILVHITSYHSSKVTDSDRIAKHLRDAFHTLADLFDD